MRTLGISPLLITLALTGCASLPQTPTEYHPGYDMNGDPYPVIPTRQCSCVKGATLPPANSTYIEPWPVMESSQPGASLPYCGDEHCPAPTGDVGQQFSL